MTIDDLGNNVSVLQKSVEVNFKQEKLFEKG